MVATRLIKLSRLSWFKLRALAVIGAVALLGYVVTRSFAAGPLAAFEPETAALSAGATTATVSGASGSGVVKFTAGTTPTPSSTPSSSPAACASSTQHVPDGPDGMGGCWPGPSNTGVPAGITLTNYTGSCTITAAGTVIDSKLINNCDRLDIGASATNVLIKNSRINTVVYNDDVGSFNGSVTLQDSEVDAGSVTYGAVTFKNITVIRSDIRGGQHNVLCASNCKIYDSYLHDPYVQGATHNNGFISNGGNDYLIEHSTVSCNVPTNNTGGGCSGDVSWFGDFGPISYATLNRSLLTANTGLAYCLYAGHDTKPYGSQANHITVTNNIFQRGTNNKCGAYGPDTNYWHDTTGQPPPNSVWSNNKWSDGTAL